MLRKLKTMYKYGVGNSALLGQLFTMFLVNKKYHKNPT